MLNIFNTHTERGREDIFKELIEINEIHPLNMSCK